MKKLTLLVMLFLIYGSAQAQKKQNVYFLKNSGKYLDSKDSADFIRVIQEPDSGSTDFKLLEQYVNGKPKARGRVSRFDPELVYEGQLVKYRDNGKKESLITYNNGKPVGQGFFFFENGKVNRIVDYDSVSTAIPRPLIPMPTVEMVPYRLIYFGDSLGTAMIENGNGHFKLQSKSGDEVTTEEGEYVDGLKNGLWTETKSSGTYWLKEKFFKGKFLSGESFKDGQTYLYAVQEEFPVYDGGMEQFYKYLAYTIRYPADAQRDRISGKVFLSFIVEKDGSLTDIKANGSVSPSIDEEAIRVLKKSPKWIPGKQHGIPVRVKYNIPITFALR